MQLPYHCIGNIILQRSLIRYDTLNLKCSNFMEANAVSKPALVTLQEFMIWVANGL